LRPPFFFAVFFADFFLAARFFLATANSSIKRYR
jgi:hypothetical protein